MTQAIQVEVLVLDSTNGSISRTREYAPADAETMLLDIVAKQLKYGSVHVLAHRGTLYRVLQLLSRHSFGVPTIVTERRAREIRVYGELGCYVPAVVIEGSLEARAASRASGCLYLYSGDDRWPRQFPRNHTDIRISAFMTDGRTPLVLYGESSFRIALPDHADYQGILEYVSATGARYVLVDGTRGGYGLELARAIQQEIGIEAEEFSETESREWGV